MNRILLFTGGLLTFLMAMFKIAMPYVFQWREAMGSSAATMWSILFSENLGISMLLLFFASMSFFQWRELLTTALGKVVMLSLSVLWIYRAVVEVLVFKIGLDGAWWRFILFLILAGCYLIPLAATIMSTERRKIQTTV